MNCFFPDNQLFFIIVTVVVFYATIIKFIYQNQTGMEISIIEAIEMLFSHPMGILIILSLTTTILLSSLTFSSICYALKCLF